MRTLQRKAPSTNQNADRSRSSALAPAIVHDTLRSPGVPLDATARASFEKGLGHDFSRVRVHTDAAAAQSAQAVNSLAYTVGSEIVFGPQKYEPSSVAGRRLLAHELTHVVQQRDAGGARSGSALEIAPAGSTYEAEAERVSAQVTGTTNGKPTLDSASVRTSVPTLMRADPDAVSQIMKLRTVVGAAIQFWPTNVTDTRIGPVTIQGGLLNSRASRLNVIIGANLTPRIMARELLPLWTTATPFTPPGGGPPVAPG
ncbi:MAG TPA: DUF4157 domain-containing protein, partial [Longimicrobiales bacterium]|nr:DUF4157 domain-containing protein [Longimicrobiales bacterium]